MRVDDNCPPAQRKELPVKALAALFIALLVVGCGSQPAPAPRAERAPDSAGPAPAEVSFAKDIQTIVASSCLPCHSGAQGAASKANWTTYEGVMADVVAGKPDSSKFYQSLRDGKMPPSGKLNSARIALVYNWIAQGAKNN